MVLDHRDVLADGSQLLVGQRAVSRVGDDRWNPLLLGELLLDPADLGGLGADREERGFVVGLNFGEPTHEGA